MYVVTATIDGEQLGLLRADTAEEMTGRLWGLLADWQSQGASVIGDPNTGFIVIKDCTTHESTHEVVLSRVHLVQDAIAN